MRTGGNAAARWSGIGALLTMMVLVAIDPRGVAHAAPSAGRDTAHQARAAAGEPWVLGGDEVVMLDRPVRVGASTRLGSPWVSLDASVAAVPPDLAGAVLLSGKVSSSSRAGTVSVRPAGAQGAGHPLTHFRPSGGFGTTLVKLGSAGSFQVRGSGGRPATEVRVVGWVPRSALLGVPETVAGRTVEVRTNRRVVTLPGLPDEATAAVVQLTRVARRAGALSAWPVGGATPTPLAFGRGTSSTLQVLPAADGRVNLRSSRGAVRVTVRTVGWTVGESTLDPLDGSRLGSIRPGAVRTVQAPTGSRQAWSSVVAPAGASVRVWGNATGAGTPAYAWRSDGSAASVVVPVGGNGRFAVRVSGTRASSAVMGHAAGTDLGEQEVVLEPQPGTRMLGAGDVVELNGTTATLSRTAPRVAVGEHLQLRDEAGLPHTLRVVTTQELLDGRLGVEVAEATLADAYVDVQLHYATDLSPAQRRPAGPQTAAGLGASLGLGNWSCSAGGQAPSFDLEFTGDPNLDVDLSGGTVDFSLRGQLTSGLQWQGSQSVSCSYETTLAQIPLGALPVALKLSPNVTATLNPVGQDSTLTLSSTQRLYASIYYDGNEPITGQSLSADASGDAELGRGGAQLDIGLKVGLGPGSLGELEIGPEVSATLGASYQLGPPDPSNDPLGRHLSGPRCTDVTNTLFLSMGAALLVPFLPDVSLDVARFDTDPVTLDRGPCVGYSGTITYTYRGSNVAGAASCDDTDQPCSDWEHRVVKSMVPQPASFLPWGEVRQPYAWTWDGRDRSYVKNQAGTSWGFLCSTTDSFTGVGSAGWQAFDSPEGWTTPSIFSTAGPASQVSAQMSVDHGRGTRQRTVVDHDLADGFPCGDSGSEAAQLPGVDLATPGTGGADLSQPFIGVVALGSTQPPGVSEARFALTRVEFER